MKTKSRELNINLIKNQIEELADCQHITFTEAAAKLAVIHGKGKEISRWRNAVKQAEKNYDRTSTETLDGLGAPLWAYDFVSVVACLVDTDISAWKAKDLNTLNNIANGTIKF